MNPAFSVIAFTLLVGAGQGLAVALAVALLTGATAVDAPFLQAGLLAALALLVAGLAASFAHLGRPARAWRAAAMWRTSWLSREVIVLPATIGVLALWWIALRTGVATGALPLLFALLTLLLCALLWACTGMIYACIRFIQEWAHPLTLATYTLTGLASGLVLATALAALLGEGGLVAALALWAIAATLVAGAVRAVSLARNARLVPRSTLQSATGIRAAQLRQVSMGMSAGSFNTREFFHRATARGLRHVKIAGMVLGFVLPAVLLAWGLATGSAVPLALAVLTQAPGLVAERWFFFAQARHPQNLYYQRVS